MQIYLQHLHSLNSLGTYNYYSWHFVIVGEHLTLQGAGCFGASS